MTSPTKVLFLEIDAGDKELIRSWAEDGTMPNVRALLNRGLTGDTMAPEGMYVGGIWPSLYTGVTPARHGIHSLVQLRHGSYEFQRCTTAEHIKREPFWNFLSRAGRRCAVLDIPLSGISREINGIQSVEWGSHDANYGFCAWPPEFEADVKEKFGLHPWSHSCNVDHRTPEDFVRFRDALVEGVRTKARLTKHYLSQGNWDFFAQVFTESHCVGHQCWHLHDPAHPGYDEKVSAITGNPLRDVYQEIDTAIGEIVEMAGDDATVILLAGHRMSHKFGAQFLLPDILDRLGVARLRAAAASPSRKAITGLDDVLTWGWQQLPGAVKKPLMGVRRQLRGAIDSTQPVTRLPPSVSRLDATTSHCFLTDNGFPSSGLRLNIKGREPDGLLSRGEEVEQFCAQLTDDLLALRDVNTGKPMVDSVRRTADMYQGEYLDHLPDLLVMWNEEIPLGSATCGNDGGSVVRVQSDKTGLVEGVNTYCRTGDHRPEGMFVANGPGVRAGSVGQTVSITDFAPTFCELLGVPLDDVDGHTIDGICAITETA